MAEGDAGWCVVREALETAVSMLGEEMVQEIINSGSEEKILELARVFMWINWRRQKLYAQRPSCSLHHLTVHVHAGEFFLEEQGWFDFLLPDA